MTRWRNAKANPPQDGRHVLAYWIGSSDTPTGYDIAKHINENKPYYSEMWLRHPSSYYIKYWPDYWMPLPNPPVPISGKLAKEPTMQMMSGPWYTTAPKSLDHPIHTDERESNIGMLNGKVVRAIEVSWDWSDWQVARYRAAGFEVSMTAPIGMVLPGENQAEPTESEGTNQHEAP